MKEQKKICVTQEEVDANMEDVMVRTEIEFDKPVTCVTVRMRNGFTIRESSTCVDAANYDEETGTKICLEKIEDKVWYLLGYALQEKMHQCRNELNATAYMMMSGDYRERFVAEYLQEVIRLERLEAMCQKWDEGKLGFAPTCPRGWYERQMSLMRDKLELLRDRAELEGIEVPC